MRGGGEGKRKQDSREEDERMGRRWGIREMRKEKAKGKRKER